MTFEQLRLLLLQVRSRSLTASDYNRLIPKIEHTRQILSQCEIGERDNIIQFPKQKRIKKKRIIKEDGVY